jgi:inorganic pyrophosphatase
MSEHPLHCLVEIPKGSRNKYEWDDALGGIKLDRFLFSSVVYPTDYGFVTDTLGEDGDPLDALVLVTAPTFPGCLVPCDLVGVFDMADEAGEDAKLLCVPHDDPTWSQVRDVDQVRTQLLDEIQHFFDVYKDLEAGKHTEVRGWRDREAAQAIFARGRDAWLAANAEPVS